jgi:hypothetical protein
MSAFYTSAFVQGRRDAETHSQQKRVLNAQAWNAYLTEARQSGREVSPQELDRYRRHLTGGDSFFMGHLPSQMMLDDISQQNNRRAEQARVEDLGRQVEQQAKITEAARGLAGYEDDPETVLKNLVAKYGEQQGKTMFGQIEQRLPELQNQNVKDRAATLFESPQALNLVRPEDVKVFFGRENPRVQRELEQMTQARHREQRNTQISSAVDAINKFPPDTFRNMQDRDEFVRAQLAAQGLFDATPEEIARGRALVDVMASVSTANRLEGQNDQFRDDVVKDLMERVNAGEQINAQMVRGVADAWRLKNELPPFRDMKELEETLGAGVVRWAEHHTYKKRFDAAIQTAQQQGLELAVQEAEQYNVRLNEAAQNLIVNRPPRSPRMANHDPGHTALLQLIQKEQILFGSPSMHARRAAELHHSGELRNAQGVTTPEAIEAALVQEFGVTNRQEMALEFAAEAMALQNLGLEPGITVTELHEDLMKELFKTEQLLVEKIRDPNFQNELGATMLDVHNNIDRMEKMLYDREQMMAFREYVGNDKVNGMHWETALAEAISEMREWADGLQGRVWNHRERIMQANPQEEVLPSTGQPIAGGRIRLSDGSSLNPDQADARLAELYEALEQTPQWVGEGRWRTGNIDYIRLQEEIRKIETQIKNEEFQNRPATGRGSGARTPRPPQTDDEEPEPSASPTAMLRPRMPSLISSASASDVVSGESFMSDRLVTAAADTAFWFESRNGAAPDRPNSDFIGPYQIGARMRKDLGLTEKDARDPRKARAAYERWASERAIPALLSAKIEPTASNIYLTWQQGVTGFREIHEFAENNRSATATRQHNMDQNPPPGSARRTGLSPKEWLRGWQEAIEKRYA